MKTYIRVLNEILESRKFGLLGKVLPTGLSAEETKVIRNNLAILLRNMQGKGQLPTPRVLPKQWNPIPQQEATGGEISEAITELIKKRTNPKTGRIKAISTGSHGVINKLLNIIDDKRALDPAKGVPSKFKKSVEGGKPFYSTPFSSSTPVSGISTTTYTVFNPPSSPPPYKIPDETATRYPQHYKTEQERIIEQMQGFDTHKSGLQSEISRDVLPVEDTRPHQLWKKQQDIRNAKEAVLDGVIRVKPEVAAQSVSENAKTINPYLAGAGILGVGGLGIGGGYLISKSKKDTENRSNQRRYV